MLGSGGAFTPVALLRNRYRLASIAGEILKSWLGQTNRGRRAHGKPVSIAGRPDGDRDEKRLKGVNRNRVVLKM